MTLKNIFNMKMEIKENFLQRVIQKRQEEFDYEFETKHWRFGRKWDTDSLPIFDPNLKSVKSFLSSAIQTSIKELLEEVMPKEFQSMPVEERPKLYEDKGWLGWNAYRSFLLFKLKEAGVEIKVR